MAESINFGDLDDLAQLAPLDAPGLGGILGQ
jgi:hypothetical protein